MVGFRGRKHLDSAAQQTAQPQQITETACRQRGARGFCKILRNKSLRGRGSVARSLDEGVVGGELCRRDREEAFVRRKALSGEGIATLVRP